MLASGFQPSQPPSPITREKLLVVEGPDAMRFFIAALSHLGVADTVEVRSAGGHSEWPAFIRALLVTPGFEGVESLALIRDAERNARSAFQSVSGLLKRAGLAVPRTSNTIAAGIPRVSVFILPDCTSPGMLETLCLGAVADDPAMVCVEQFLKCVHRRATTPPANVDKARLHAFLASRVRPDLRLTEAVEKGLWPWESPTLEHIMRFLINL